MIAVAWPWSGGRAASGAEAQRLGASLCAGIGGQAATAEVDGLHFAWRPLCQSKTNLRGWRPARLADGRLVVLNGYLDNAAQIAAELKCPLGDLAALYGQALTVWGDEADARMIGEFSAVVADPHGRTLRLSRSQLRAPPLTYYQDETIAVVASVPRAIFALGVEQHFDETRAADSAMMNFTDLEASWYVGLRRVPLSSVVELAPSFQRRLRKYYDLADVARQRPADPQAYVERARELLDEAVSVTLAGFSRPGATLSSGLDSPQVAVRALAALPPGQNLPTFTFHPESSWDGITDKGFNGNERPMVEAFAAMHPGIEPHFTANEGYGHDHRWNDLFLLMGGAPSGMCNMYLFHGLLDLARKQECDVLLLAEWGNFTFSDTGHWALVEYLLKGRWRQLWLALKHQRADQRPMWLRFLALSLVPLLSDRWWRRLRRIWFPNEKSYHDMMVPLRQSYRESSGAEQRWARAGFNFNRYQPRNRAHARELLFANLDSESAEIYQAFEQLYGIPLRDPLAYRPFVEFCFGLPTEVFVRDGEMRWLAKELAKGIMPEEQRRNKLNGRWDADWHLRIKRRRDDYLQELDRIEADDELNAMIDVPRLRDALADFPETTITDQQRYYPIEFAVMRGLLTARFINYVKGRNRS